MRLWRQISCSARSRGRFVLSFPPRPRYGADEVNTNNSSLLVYRPDIDGLRAFAVLCVVVYHAFPTLLEAGFIGVDIFFVISGYLISGIILNALHQGTFTLWNFYSRRIRRIFPALLVVLAAVLVFGWFTLLPDEYSALGKHVFGGASFISNFLLWQEAGYFDAVARSKPLLHLWSLGIEEQFYIVFPLLLWMCAKARLRAATVIIALCIVSFLDNMYCMPHPTANFYNPLARAWELLAGAALCAAMRQASAQELYLKLDALAGRILCRREEAKDGRSLGLALALSGTVLLILALLLVRHSAPYPGWQALLPVFGTVLLIAAGSSNPVSRHLFANRGAVFIGLVSYPFYLWHWVLISYAYILKGGLDASTGLLRAGLVAASFVLAVLTYFLVEKPIRFGAWARKGKVYALIACMVIAGAAGLCAHVTDGLPARANVRQWAAITKQLARHAFTDEAGLAYAGIEKGRLTYCRYTDVGASETVAVIGDSHAWSAYLGIAKLGWELQYNTVLLGWIVPAGAILAKHPGAATGAGAVWNPGLAKNIDIIFDVLKRRKDIKKVFFCTRGRVYIHDYTGNLAAAVVEEENCRRIGYEVYKESLQSYVDTLRAYGKNVFITSDNPELPANIHNYIASSFNLVLRDKVPDVYKDDVIKKQGRYPQLLSEITNATIIDAIGPFCPDGKCLVFTEDGLPMYMDSDHLSAAGSEFQADRIFRPYLAGSRDE